MTDAHEPKPNAQDAVSFPADHAETEAPEKTPGPFEAPAKRTGFAIVGLGRLATGQILPAMGKSKYCKPVALVSGDRDKAGKIAAQYGIAESSVYDYQSFDRLRDNAEVDVIYIVLPNSMHKEFVVRGAKAGKHILCEKPMATSTAECERMIAACREADMKLMIAYRNQYEPFDRALADMAGAGKLGRLKQMIATNSQDMARPAQWRLQKALAGGGCLPDLGVYCINAARFLSGEEPAEAIGNVVQPKDDPRFAEVEASCQAILRFPSGFVAVFNCGFNAHTSALLRLEGETSWAELNPAFGYHGIRLAHGQYADGQESRVEPQLQEQDQFAAEMDHFALCVQQNLQPHTPGEEGLQDIRVMEAIYESARSGQAQAIAAPDGPTRGPWPAV